MMSIVFDITKELEELKASFTCDVCKNILQEPMILDTCKHVICKDCLDEKAQACPVCKNPYCERDIEDDIFGVSVLSALNNIERIFNAEYVDDAPPEVNPNEFEAFKFVNVEMTMKRNPKGETPLHLACKKGNAKKVEELLQKTVDVNVADYANWSALHEAVQHGHHDCCRLLLQEGALPDVPGEFYITPLHKAVLLDNTRIAKLLIEHGASKDSIDYFGKKASDLSVSTEMMNVLENTSRNRNTKPSVYLAPSPIIFYKEISKECKEKLTKLKVKFVTVQDFIKRDDVTHLVLEKTDSLDVMILVAIVKGIFVVQKQWVDIYRRVEDEVAFAYIPDAYRDAVTKSVCNRWMQRPKLFDGISFHILDHEKPQKISGLKLNKKDLITLIERGGGTHVVRPPALRTVEGSCYFPYHVDKKSELTMCCNYIIYNSSKPPELLYNMKELRHKSSKWLIDCILNFNIIDS